MKFYTPVHVRFSDLDALGHVNNALYFTYVEDARITYFKTVVGERHDWKKFGVLLAHNEINYREPVLLNDELECGIRTDGTGDKSIRCSFEFRVKRNGKIVTAAEGKFVLVCFDNIKKRSAEVPESWRAAFKRYEEA